MPCIEYKGKKYTYEEFGAMLRDGAFAKMAKSGELNIENLGAKVPSSLLETTRKKITPETSSNFANLTVDEDGNYVFFHRGAKGYTEIKPGTGQSGITPSNEATAIGRVGGVAMYYTTPDESERMVSGDAQYAVTVAPDEVYDFNEDPENYIVEARDRFEKENPGKAFDANNQLAYITKIAGENGYKMVVAEWINGRTRAQTTEAMKPTDVKLLDGDVVKKDFDKKYKKNKDMGWESVVPETKDDKLNKLYLKIYKERSDKNRYDDLYHLAEDAPKKTQDEITKLINESDISQELKDEYNQILGEKEQTRKSKKKVANDTVAEVERIKSLDKAAEDGATFNLDGTKYEGVGLVVPAASVNTTVEELTPEMIMDFVEQQRSKIGDDAVVKVGIYKFKNSNKVSIDLNIIAPESSRDVAIEFGRLAGQESLFDLRTFENIKTGADGKNPMKFSDKQFKEIAKALKEGKMPNVFGAKETTALDDIFDNTEIQSEVDNALKAMSEIMPELNIVVHDTYESYLEALGEAEEAESGGFFDGENTIHINRRAASDTTVAHEVFHAVLKKMLGSERAIQKKALSMVLNLSGQIKSDPKLKAALNEFVSRYTENPETMNEEAVSELFGMLNAGYAELKPVERSAIRKFIDAIAKLLGLGDLLRVKENEYVDLLNTLSQRIRTGEAITAEDVVALDNEMLTPGSQVFGTSTVKKSIQAVVKGFDTTPPKVDGVDMVYPDKSTIDEVLEKSGGAAVFINSDGTKVGSVIVNGRKIILQGGIDYTFIKKNTEDNIGFAASEDSKISVLKSISEQIVKERDSKFPEHKGKPVAVFVAVQNGGVMLGEWYASEYIMEGIDKAITSRKYKGGLTKAKKDFTQAIKSSVVGNGKDQKADQKAKDKLLKMIQDGMFDTHEGRLKIAKEMSSKSFSFGFRVNLNKQLIAGNEKTANSGNNTSIKRALVNAGHTLIDFWEKFLDERFLPALRAEKKLNDKGSTVGNKTLSGFFYDPSKSLDEQVKHARLGIEHDQFNSSFESKGNFLLDTAYDVNKLFPNMGYPSDKGIEEYNKANNTNFTKKTMTIPDKTKVSEWLNNNDKSNLVINPFTSISGSMYTGIVAPVKKQIVGQNANILSDAQKKAYDKLSKEDKEVVDELIYDELYERSINATEETEETKDLFEDEINNSAISFEEALNKALNLSEKKQVIPEDIEVFTFGNQKYDINKANEIISRDSLDAIDVPVNVLPKMSYSFISVDKKTVDNADITKPVIIARTETGLLLIDGHHRVRKAINENKPIKAFVLDENQTSEVTKTPKTVKKQTPAISKKIEAALNSGATEQEIIDKMTQVGYTEAEAKAYIEQYNNMRSDEYSKVKANIDKITKKIADRASKNANPKVVRQRQYDDAMNYLQNSLWYENASDTEREASVRELRSDLGFREKAAPAAAKVTEGKRDTITIDSLQALAQSIRDQNIGAKAALKDLAEKREALRVALNALVNKAKITARQATTILNKFSKVNLNDDQAVKDLIEYVEQTYKDAEITNQVRQAAQTAKDERRGAKAALKDLAEKREALRVALNSLVTSGKITNRQASVMLNKVMSVNLNNDNAVDKLIKYIEKVYNNAEIAEKMSKANGMRRTAKKNIKSKIGSAKVAFPLLDKLFSIDSRQIPLEVLDTYSNLVNQFGKRVGVLTTDNMSSVIQDAQDVIDAINEEESRAKDLAMIFDMYPDKVTDSNGEIDFNQTVKKMKDDGYIDEATAKEMDEYRTDIFKKERATREDDAQERKDLIAEISAAILVTSSRLADPNERKAAREIIQMARSRTLLKKLSTTSLRNLAAIMKNIDAGFFPNYGVKLMQAMQVEQQAPLVNETVSDVNLRVISTAYNRFKALTKLEGWRNNTGVAIQKTLESNMTTDLDFMLGDNKKRYIYDYIIKPLAKAYASFDTEATAVKEKMTEAVNMLEKQFNGNTNRVAESKFKMMAYMLQKEFETNPGQKGVAPAVDFINQTIKAIKARDTEYSERDIELLESIKNSYSTNGQIDMNKIFDSFSPREKKALSIVEDLNKSMYDKAIFTSGVIRGNRTQMYNNYVPHSVLPSKMSKDDKITSVNNAYNNTQAVGTKAGSLQQRTPGAKPIMFDPFLASMNSAVDILLDFHMTIPMQTTNKLVRKVKKDLNDNPNTTNKSKDAINAIQQVRDNITKFVFTNNKYYDDSVFGSLGRSFLSTMYRNTLGSVPRFANELISNFSYVIANPKNWATGLKHVFKDSDYVGGASLRDIMTSVNSTVTGKVCGKKNTGKFSDIGFLGSDNASHGSKSKNAFENTKDIISRYTKKPLAELTEYVGEKLISTPDMLMSKPTWVGAFANEFKKQTGTDVEFSKLTDERYKNKYKAAIDAATDYADNEVIQAGSTVNPFQKAAKMNVDQSAPVTRKLFAQVNNYLTNFMITEFSTARAAAYSLVTEGRLPKAKAAGVMTGVYMRIVMYTLLSNAMAGVFYGALGYDDDDEETITWDDIVQAATGGFISILVNRNFGNLFKMVENYGVEKLNEEYGDMLRSGEEYDPYKHSLAFNKIKEKDIARDPAKFATVTLAGPYAMPVKTAWKISDLIEYEGRYVGKGAEQKIIQKEKDYSIGGVLKKKRMEKTKDEVLFNVAAGSGLVPFAKDIRPIISGVQKKKGEN